MNAPADMKTVRTRSVDNLQRLYTVVISLALTEYLRRLLSPVEGNGSAGYNGWLMFVSLVFTVVPFYHGANRYLDATYVTSERAAKPGTLMVDFLFLFAEGLGFFVIAMLATQGPAYFYTGLAMLLILDAVWVGFTNLTAASDDDKFPGYGAWATVNYLAAFALLVFVWSNAFDLPFWKGELARDIALMGVTIVRTVFDYFKVWNFYYPKGVEHSYDALPAPAPAPPPQEHR